MYSQPQVNLPTQAEITDATAVRDHGSQPEHVSGDPTDPCDLPEQRRRSGQRPDFRYGAMMARSAPSARTCFPSSHAPSYGRRVNIAANNALDLNNFHVKFDYIFNPSHRIRSSIFSATVCRTSQRRLACRSQSDRWPPTRTCGIRWPPPVPSWPDSTTPGQSAQPRCWRAASDISGSRNASGSTTTLIPNALGINTGPLGANAARQGKFWCTGALLSGIFRSNCTIRSSVAFRAIPSSPGRMLPTIGKSTSPMIKGNHTIKIGGQYQDAYTKISA